MDNTFNQDDLIATFVTECDENLGTLEQLLVVLESSVGDQELVDTVFRCAHTLKGNAATLGLDSITRIAHVLEDVLEGVREGRLPVTRSLVSMLLQATDRLRQLIPESLAGRDSLDSSTVQLLQRLSAAGADVVSSAESVSFSGRGQKGSGLPSASSGSRRLRVDLAKL